MAHPDGDNLDVTTLFSRRADGSAAATRLLTPEFDLDVEASPDGTKIAYTSVRPYSTSGVYVADPDGTDERFLHPGRGPDWSPDGSRILLWSEGGLYVVDQDGSNPTQLPEPAGHSFVSLQAWRWHPDGVRVSFDSSAGTDCSDVYAMNLDGTNVTRVTRADCTHTSSTSTGIRPGAASSSPGSRATSIATLRSFARRFRTAFPLCWRAHRSRSSS